MLHPHPRIVHFACSHLSPSWLDCLLVLHAFVSHMLHPAPVLYVTAVSSVGLVCILYLHPPAMPAPLATPCYLYQLLRLTHSVKQSK